MKIRNYMTRHVTCINPNESLRRAYEIMRDEEIRHLPVVQDDNVLVGVLSERDILLRASFFNDTINVPEIDVAQVMTTEIVSCKSGQQMHDVARLMLERRIDALPVINSSGEIEGIVTSSDFLELAAAKDHHSPNIYNPIPFNFTINRFKPEATLNANSGLRSNNYDTTI